MKIALILFLGLHVVIATPSLLGQQSNEDSNQCRAELELLKEQDLTTRTDLTILRSRIVSCAAKFVNTEQWRSAYQVLHRIDAALEHEMMNALLASQSSQASLASKYNQLIDAYNLLLSSNKRIAEAARQAGSSWNSQSAGQLLHMIASDEAESAKIQPKHHIACSSTELDGMTYIECR